MMGVIEVMYLMAHKTPTHDECNTCAVVADDHHVPEIEEIKRAFKA
jgi:hypothetical protein